MKDEHDQKLSCIAERQNLSGIESFIRTVRSAVQDMRSRGNE